MLDTLPDLKVFLSHKADAQTIIRIVIEGSLRGRYFHIRNACYIT